jgi:PAS domain S-box-containing protein
MVRGCSIRMGVGLSTVILDGMQAGLAEAPSARFLAGGGSSAKAIAEKDWSTSPLGPPSEWPQSLRVALDICLHNAFPIVIFWGPELRLLYNDAYHLFLTDKHPRALGEPAREVWPEIWDVIGPMLQGVLADGKATRSEDLQLHLLRNGRRDEGYFTFSYGPIPDEEGKIGGVFCPVVETTDRVIGERRLRTLRDLSGLGRAENEAESCRMATHVLEADALDLPFAMIYRFDERGGAALIAATGIRAGEQASRPHVRFDRPDAASDPFGDPWGLAAIAGVKSGQIVLSDLAERFTVLPRTPWSSPPEQAVLLPIVMPGEDRPAAALIAALNPLKRFDAAYSYFLDRVAAKIAIAMADARAYAAERRRAADIRSREAELRRTEAELREAQRLGRIGSWRWDASTGKSETSEYFSQIFGLDPAKPLPGFADQKGLLYAPEAWERLDAAIRQALRTGGGFELDLPARRVDGAAIWITIRGEAVRDDDGEIIGLRSSVQDITERKRAQERLELLMHEVTHRAKNLLTVVRAVARQTARKDSPAAFAERFDQRIAALGASHDLLVKNEWRGVDLHELTRSQLAHFRDLFGTRIRVEGRPAMAKPAASQAIGMALHELATNAGKYGALSNDKGTAHISFGVMRENGADWFEMAWRETGGPAVSAPKRLGFGHMVIVQMVNHALGGRVALDYAPEGVAWQVRAPLDNVIESTPGED